ncbi:MAG: acyl-CoA synthetase, partial [Actinobacteria bacterium]
MPNMVDYEGTRATFRLDVPDEYNFTRDVIDAQAADRPHRVALIAVEPDGVTGSSLTFSQLATLADRAAHVLRGAGIDRGDHVFVQLPRVVDWYSVLLGCFKIGAVPMPATTQLMPKDQEYRINRAEAVAAVTDSEGAERLEQVSDSCHTLKTLFVVGPDRPGWRSWVAEMESASRTPADAAPTRSDDPLLLYFTSGTTGEPKMVQHAGSYAVAHEITARFWHDLG